MMTHKPQRTAGHYGKGRRPLSHLAFQTPSAEGAWALTEVEGKIPRDLRGTLYRIAPGQKESYGTALRHFFDGDAFVSSFTFQEGRVHLQARFVDTPQRLEELMAGRMLYPEFGTLPPPPPLGWKPEPGGKNQPSINLILWDNRLLGLSEGGHPAAIDPEDLSYQGRWDFYGTLPRDVPFTAHPKFDPQTGEGYAFGVKQGPGSHLTVYRMEANGKLTQLYALPQKGHFMIHDLMLAREHLIFVIPPVRFDLAVLFSGKVTIAETLRYFENEPTRFLILRRDGKGLPVTIEQPASMVFHHGNAFERQGKIVVDSLLAPDHSVLELLMAWSKDQRPKTLPPQLTRLVLDPLAARVESRTILGIAQEFPRFDIRKGGDDLRYLYTLESGIPEDLFSSTALVRFDLHRGTSQQVEAGPGRVLGEAVFAPHPGTKGEDHGWLLMQGYDARRDENFLEVRDAGELDFVARVWAAEHFPLGFHGNFYPILSASE